MTAARTRLDQLRDLRRRVDQEITAAEWGLCYTKPQRALDLDLKRAGTTDAEVRAWAQSLGIRVPDRGRVSRTLVQSYARAHSEAAG